MEMIFFSEKLEMIPPNFPYLLPAWNECFIVVHSNLEWEKFFFFFLLPFGFQVRRMIPTDGALFHIHVYHNFNQRLALEKRKMKSKHYRTKIIH